MGEGAGPLPIIKKEPPRRSGRCDDLPPPLLLAGIAQFNAGGVACGLISDMREVFAEPQIEHLGMVKDVVSARLGPQRLVGQPMQLARTPSTIARSAPLRGEHTVEVLRELGIEADEIDRLKATGVH